MTVAPRGPRAVDVVGAGIAGTWQALALARAGCEVTVFERGAADLAHATSHVAGGMLAPWCESETSEPLVTRLGERGLALWKSELPDTPFEGSLVVAHARDRADLERFARLTASSGHQQRLDGEGVARLEPALAGRFAQGLYFAGEGHVDPRVVLPALHARLASLGVTLCFETEHVARAGRLVVDCRGLAARDVLPDLRGVKGEMILVETEELTLTRPVRLLHPRWPLYVVPRAAGRFLVGASSIESESGGVTVRSALELLSAAYALQPAFGEARVVELGAGLRPAFTSHLPRIDIRATTLRVNGLHRHGFMLAPALAELTAAWVTSGTIDEEVMRCS